MYWSLIPAKSNLQNYSLPSPKFPQIKWYVLRGQPPPASKMLLPNSSLSWENKNFSLVQLNSTNAFMGHRSLFSHDPFTKKCTYSNPFFHKRCVFQSFHSWSQLNRTWTDIYLLLISLCIIPGVIKRREKCEEQSCELQLLLGEKKIISFIAIPLGNKH